MGTVCLERNKGRRVFALYSIVIQFFIVIIALSIFGYYIGQRVSENPDIPILGAGIGLMFGVFIGFVTLYKFVQSEERYEKNVHH